MYTYIYVVYLRAYVNPYGIKTTIDVTTKSHFAACHEIEVLGALKELGAVGLPAGGRCGAPKI